MNELLETLNLAEGRPSAQRALRRGAAARPIGRALINRPALVLADEPTGNLDSKNSQEIVDLLKLSNRRYHQTLLLVPTPMTSPLQRRPRDHPGRRAHRQDEVIRQ